MSSANRKCILKRQTDDYSTYETLRKKHTLKESISQGQLVLI